MRQSTSMEEGRGEISENFPCIFPLKQGISAETGSQQTAPTARQSHLRQGSLSEIFCLLGEAGKPVCLQESRITPTEGKIIRMARASLANGGV